MPARRAIQVCTGCHRRKLRCDVDETQGTCSKCAELGEICTVRRRKEYRPRKLTRLPIEDVVPLSCAINDGQEQSHVQETRLVASVVARPSATFRPLFAGTGGYGDILRMVSIEQRHFLVPAETERVLDPADLAYLKAKGCFDLPDDSKALMEAYFLYVHSWFPIVDGPAICRACANGKFDGINLLLLWSMFSIAASYVPHRAHHSVKRDFVQRASLLFHLAPENDKFVLVQSALLLSFWFDEAEDIKQSWYWSGIAFSISQSLGLHRDHDGPAVEPEALRRDLWRACMFRDVWLSFGMGRPLRLHIEDCNVPVMPTSGSTLRELMLFDNSRPLFTATEAQWLFKSWQRLNELSNALRGMLSSTAPDIPRLDAVIEGPLEDLENTEYPLSVLVVKQHFNLHSCAVRLHYYTGRKEFDRASRTVAETDSLVQSFMITETLSYIAPVAIPLIVPASTYHLQQMRQKPPKPGDTFSENTKPYFQFLSSIENNYPAASILSRLLSAASDWEQHEESSVSSLQPSS